MSAPTCGDAGGVTKEGTRCPVTANLSPANGRCPWHDPDPTRRRAIADAGGAASAAKRRGARPGIERMDLGPLDTVEDALRWTRVIGTALAERAILPSEANALLRVVAQWRANEDLRLRREDLRDLERQVRDLQQAKGGTE